MLIPARYYFALDTETGTCAFLNLHTFWCQASSLFYQQLVISYILIKLLQTEIGLVKVNMDQTHHWFVCSETAEPITVKLHDNSSTSKKHLLLPSALSFQHDESVHKVNLTFDRVVIWQMYVTSPPQEHVEHRNQKDLTLTKKVCFCRDPFHYVVRHLK